MNHQLHSLKNGLKTILVDTQTHPSLTTLLLVGAGSRYENRKNNGVAHFFEHMAFKGTKKYPSTLLISSIVEGLGGLFNAFTTKDNTGYWIKAIPDHFEKIIDILSDMILNPLLVSEEIEKEKGVIVEEINLYEDTPYQKVSDLFENILYPDNPLGYDVAGTRKSVTKFSRQTFLDYIKYLYHPANAILVLAGGLKQNKSNLNDYLKIIEKKFNRWNNHQQKCSFVKVNENQTRPQTLIKYKKTEQTHFCLGFRAFSFFDERKYALSILSTILGGGMSSRLFIEVREKRGLCYYISTGRELYHDVGNFVTRAGVTNDITKIKEAVEVILIEHKKMADGKITQEELTRAKEMIKGRLLLSMEDSFNVSNFFASKELLEGRIETPQEIIDKIEKVTMEQVVTLAKQVFRPSKLNLALIGPFEKLSLDFNL